MATLQKLQNDLKKLQHLQRKAQEVNVSNEETLLNAMRKKNGPEFSLNDITSSPSPTRRQTVSDDDQMESESCSASRSENNTMKRSLDDYLVSGVVITEPEIVALITRIEISKKQIGALGKMVAEKQNEIDAELNRQKVEEVD